MLYLSAPYTEVPSTCPHRYLGYSRDVHTGGARELRCAPPVARNATHSSHGAQEAHLHAEHDAPDHGHGRDQAVPGPADSLEGRQALAVKRWTSRLPGKHLPHLTGAEQNALYAGTAVEFTVKYGNVSAPSPAPSSNSPDPHRAPTLCRFGCAILGLGQAADPPSADPLHDVDMSLLQRASVLQNAAMSE